MDSATSHPHDESDDHDTDELPELLEDLAASIGDERARGSALFLSAHPKPSRAILGNPPRSTQKKREKARSDPERDEKP